MTEIAQCPAVKQINFYILEASPELLVDRRVYLEVVLLKIWRSRLETIRSGIVFLMKIAFWLKHINVA